MTIIRITKEFHFESSHVLKDYDGLCRNIHGHSYKLFVTVKGKVLNDREHPKNGMVMDFGDLRRIVDEEIVDVYDHSIVMNDDVHAEVKEAIKLTTERVIFTPFQPTCENMVADFARKIMNRLPGHLKLERVKLYETANSCAEWRSEDNPV